MKGDRQPVSILFVDDDDLCREAVSCILAEYGIAVHVVPDAEQAIVLLEQTVFDAVVSDIRLPGKSGVELLKHIRAIEDDLPILLVTGHSSIESAIEALQLGAQDYILKPLGGCEVLATSILNAVAHHRLKMKARMLERKIAEASERERRKLGHELHDVLCQDLSTIAMLSSLLKKSLKNAPADAQSDAAMIQLLATRSVAFARRLCAGLFPAELERHGLQSALENLAARQGQLSSIPCSFKGDPAIDIPDTSTALNLFRIAQEAVANSTKHSEATRISISLGKQDGQTVLTVSDNGQGFDPDQAGSDGLGLHIMQYRARTIGANLDISAAENSGTRVSCKWQ